MTTPSSATGAAVLALAEWIATAEHGDLPDDVIDRTRLLLVDSLAVAIRGAEEPEPTRLWRGMQMTGDATILRGGFPQASVADAAVANGVSMCTLELDPGSRPSGHPMLHVLPVALAVAESERCTGAELECALVLAYEAHARFQWAIDLRPGIHAHGALAAIGAVAAIGRLRGWRADRLSAAFLLAASLPIASSWSNATAGRTARDLYAAAGASMALLASRAAEAGFSAESGMFDETYGSLLGQGMRPEPLQEGLGSTFWIREAYFKYHAACALIHPVVDALANALEAKVGPTTYPPLLLRDPLDLAEVAGVRVWVPERSLKLDVAATSGLGARFSIPHIAAYYLLHGSAGPEASAGEALRDDAVRRLAESVRVIGDAGFTEQWPDHLAARVEIELADGSCLAGACQDPIGSPGHVDGPEPIRAKFDALLAGVLSPDRAAALWTTSQRLSELARASDLFGAVREAGMTEREAAFLSHADVSTEGRAGHSSW